MTKNKTSSSSSSSSKLYTLWAGRREANVEIGNEVKVLLEETVARYMELKKESAGKRLFGVGSFGENSIIARYCALDELDQVDYVYCLMRAMVTATDKAAEIAGRAHAAGVCTCQVPMHEPLPSSGGGSGGLGQLLRPEQKRGPYG